MSAGPMGPRGPQGVRGDVDPKGDPADVSVSRGSKVIPALSVPREIAGRSVRKAIRVP